MGATRKETDEENLQKLCLPILHALRHRYGSYPKTTPSAFGFLGSSDEVDEDDSFNLLF